MGKDQDDWQWKDYLKNTKPLRCNTLPIHDINEKLIKKTNNHRQEDLASPINLIPIDQMEMFFKSLEAPKIHSHLRVLEMSPRELKTKTVDFIIDLHGLTLVETESVLHQRLYRSQQENRRSLLIITGKGNVLRSFLPKWLKSQPSLVIGFSQASPNDGGSGSFYVRLRKK